MSTSPFRVSHAVVVGVDGYGPGIPPLQSAVNDARRLGRILEAEHGYTVTALLDEQASGAALAELLDRTLPATVHADDRVLFYFAGHGVALDGDDGPAGFVLPADARPGDPATYLEMTRLHDALMALPCRHMLVVLDSCFSGAFRWSSMRDVLAPPRVVHQERYDRFVHDPAWQVLTSAAYDQTAADQLLSGGLGTRGGDGAHSPFAVALFDALQGGADLMPAGGDGIVTASELFVYLEDRLQTETVARGRRQTPGLWPMRKHEKGEFIFHVPGKEMNLPPAPPLTFEHNPWRGLEAYGEAHADLFFGREEVVRELLGYVDTHPLTVVLGASGTGKSSVVKAGVLPRLREDGHHVLPVMRPGSAPLEALDTALVGVGPGDPVAAAAAWCASHPDRRLVLVVDQLEELVTQDGAAKQKEAFFQRVGALLQRHGDQIRVLFTLRSDFEPQFADGPLEELWRGGRYVVRPFTQDELREVIEEPASRRVLFFQPPDLVDDLINEVVSTPGGLPLLSFALSEMYQQYVRARRDDRALTRADYQAVGGVVGALRTRADEEYELLDPPHRDTLRDLVLRMVSADGGNLARRRILRSDLVFESDDKNARVERVLDSLRTARLVVEGQADDGAAFVEPAHDALVRAWDRLVGWMHEENRREVTNLAFRHRLARAAVEWEAEPDAEAKAGFLWRDPTRSAVLNQLLRDQAPWLNRRERAFARRSVRSHRRGRMVRLAVGVFGFVLAAAATVAAVRAAANARSARQEALVARATALGTQAAQAQDPTLRLLLATEALRATLEAEGLTDGLAGRYRSAVYEQPLLLALDELGNAHSRRMYQGWIGWMRQGAHAVGRRWFSPDGRWLVTGVELAWSGDLGCCFDLWDLSDPAPGLTALPLGPDSIGVEPGSNVSDELGLLNRGAVRMARQGKDLVAWSGDSRWLATAHTDSVTRLWALGDVRPDAPALEYRHERMPVAVDLSPDGRWLAASDGAALLWDLDAPPREGPRTLDAPADVVDLVFAAGGGWLAVAAASGSVDLWALPIGEAPAARFQADSALAVSFAPGDRWLVVESATAVTLWDPLDPEAPPFVRPHGRLDGGAWFTDPYDVSFSPDARWMATTLDGWDYTLHRLDDDAGAPGLDGSRVPGPVMFSDDGSVAVGGIQPWSTESEIVDLDSGRRLPHPSPEHTAFSPRTHTLYHAQDGIVESDITSASVTSRFGAPGSQPLRVSPDDRWLVAAVGDPGMPDRRVQLYDLANDRQLVASLPGGDFGEQWGFSPDGRWLIGQGFDMTRLVRLTDETGRSLLAPDPDGGGEGSVAEPEPQEPSSGDAAGRRWSVSMPDNVLQVTDLTRPGAEPVVLTSFPEVNSYSPQISPDERWLAVDTRVWLLVPPFPSWFVEGPGTQSRLYGPSGFSPDSRWVFVGDWQSGELSICALREMPGEMLTCGTLDGANAGGQLSGTQITADGHWLVTTNSDWGGATPETQIWNLRSANPAAHAVRLVGQGFRGVVGGPSVATADAESQMIKRWPLDPDTLLTRACRVAGRNLDTREWSRYMGERAYSCTCPGLPRGDSSGRLPCPG